MTFIPTRSEEKPKLYMFAPLSYTGRKISSIEASQYMLEKYRFHDILLIYRDFHLFLGIYWHFIILSSIYRDNLGG